MLRLSNDYIVLLYNGFDPSIITEGWYIKNGFFRADEFVTGTTISVPEVSVIQTQSLSVQITVERLAIFANDGNLTPEQIQLIKNIFEKILDEKDTLIVRAIGINFGFESDVLSNTENLSKELMSNNEVKLHQILNGSNMRFGSYVSMDYENTRLRVEAKPFKSDEKDTTERFKITYNFHKDVDKETQRKELIAAVDKWNSFRAFATQKTEEIGAIIK